MEIMKCCPENNFEKFCPKSETKSFAYIINALQIDTGNCRYVLQGEPRVVKEEQWGAWQITQISSYYRNCSQRFDYENDTANYIFMFNEELGFFVQISGTSDMEILEHIAKELEIRESDEPPTIMGKWQRI